MEAQAFIDAIVDDPDDLARWHAYADWLVARGDPRGEAIRRELVEPTDHVDDTLLAPRLRACRDRWKLTAWRTFLRRAYLALQDEATPAAMFEALFADPHAALIASVSSADPVPLEVLFAAPRRHLRELELEELEPFGDRLAGLAPRLERLSVWDPGLTYLAHPSLRRLESGDGGCRAACLGGIVAPRLEVLSWRLLAGRRDLLEEPRSLLHDPFPQLAFELVVEDATSFDLEALAELPGAATVVELRATGLPHVFVQLARLAPRFPRLRRVSAMIDIDDGLDASRGVRAQLRRAYPHARIELPVLEHAENRAAGDDV